MRAEDIEPDEEILPPNLMWYQRKGCLIILLVIILILAGLGVFAWQVKKYYNAIQTGNITPEMKELIGDVAQSDRLNALVSRDDDPSRGNENAQIVVIAFEDFQCPLCQQTYYALKEVLPEYEDKILFVYRDFPTSHEFSQKTAEAGNCANEQSNFWAYHDLLFENADLITSESALVELAARVNLDTVAFQECLDSGKYIGEVKKDAVDGTLAGVNGTPTFFINGYKVAGVYPKEFWQETFNYLLEEL